MKFAEAPLSVLLSGFVLVRSPLNTKDHIPGLFQAEQVTHPSDGVLEALWCPPNRGEDFGGLIETGARDEPLFVERPCSMAR
jgi:hypothetical protein